MAKEIIKKFTVLGGIAIRDGKRYVKGDVIETTEDLTIKWPKKYRLHTPTVKADSAEVNKLSAELAKVKSENEKLKDELKSVSDENKSLIAELDEATIKLGKVEAKAVEPKAKKSKK